ncbi:RNA polymerase sigma factor [Paucibacter sp. O1-1]|nr:RNA polymerase sigma factor [Paucibacter sp. O1-1]MDA3830146.1 RNA polymerase sigma factor [Paucibacter sp. O1-1]
MAALVDWRAVLSRVKGMLRRRGCAGDDADDLIQDAYVKLACYERTHEVSHPDAFLLRAARNLAIDAHRVRRNHGQTVLLEDVEAEVSAPGRGVSPIEDTVLDGERTARVIVILEGLPALTREIFVEHLFEGMSYPEIAASRGLRVRAVRGHVTKAMVVLMRRMEGW